MARRPRIWTGTSHEYVSVIGLALVIPLLQLLEDLGGLDGPPPNEVQAGNPENGFSAAVVVLAVTMMESALNRTRYVRRNRPNRRESSSEYFRRVTGDANLAADVEEAVAVRDAIIHNHIWKAFVGAGPDGHLRFWGVPRPSPRIWRPEIPQSPQERDPRDPPSGSQPVPITD